MEQTLYFQINPPTRSDFRFRTQVNTPTQFIGVKPTATDTFSYRRYEGLDLMFYRESMTPNDFPVFLNFVGREGIEILEEDFDVFYHED